MQQRYDWNKQIDPDIPHTSRSGKNRQMPKEEEIQAQLKENAEIIAAYKNENRYLKEAMDQSKINEAVVLAYEAITERLNTEKKRPLSIPASQPLFSGLFTENVDMWLTITENNYSISNIPLDQYVKYTLSYLREIALQTYRSLLTDNSVVTWIELKAHFIKRFSPLNLNLSLIKQLTQLKQTGDLTTYIDKFLFIMNQTHDISKDHQIFHFTQNLLPQLRQEIEYRQPKTLQEAIDFAKAYIDSHPQQNFASLNYTNSRSASQPSIKWCSFHKMNTHNTNECRRKNSLIANHNTASNNNNYGQSQNNRSNYTGQSQSRHIQNQRNTQSYNSQRPTNQYTNNNNNNNNNINSQFRPAVHNNSQNRVTNNNSNYNTTRSQNNYINMIDETPATSNLAPAEEILRQRNALVSSISIIESEHNCLKTIALLNGIPIEAVIDTACSRSVIPEYVVIQQKFKTEQTDITCTFGNSSTASNCYITEIIDVVLHDNFTKQQFIVLPRKNILLGLDWLYATQAIINVFERTISFPSKTLQLSDIDDYSNDILFTEIENDVKSIKLADYSTALYSNLPDDAIDDLDYDIWKSESNPINITDFTHLSSKYNTQLKNLLVKYKDIFATSVNDLKTPCHIGHHEIDTGSAKPIYLPPYRKSKYENDLIDKEVNNLLLNNIIQPSKSPWSSPIVLIPKPDGSKRMCINFKSLNRITTKDKFPIPRIDNIFFNLQKSNYFTKLDFKQAYYQIPLAPSAIAKTAFSTQTGHYEFVRLPFGLSNAPADFNRIMNEIFPEFRAFEEHYFDDSTVHSSTIEQHFKHLESIFIRLQEVNLKLNFEKCSFIQQEIKLFGHIVSKQFLKMDQAKIELIKNWPIPKNTSELSRFLGFTGYYRNYVDQYASITANLNQLLRKDAVWYFGPIQLQTFQFLKDLMVQYPILQLPNLDKPFIIHCDASGSGLGAILAQLDDNNNEYVCEYASRLLQGAEHHYGITEKECLSVVWATKLFRPYIYGTEYTIYTDHKALLWLLNLKDPHGRLARWSYSLQGHNATIKHRPGIHHQNVDALSRLLQTIENVKVETDVVEINTITVTKDSNVSSKILDVYEDTYLLHYLKYGSHMPGSSIKQNKRIHRCASHYRWYDNKLFYTQYPKLKLYTLIVPPIEDRVELIKHAHNLGHFKTESTCTSLRQKYFWKNMRHDVHHFICNCLPCLRNDIKPTINHPALVLSVTQIFDRIGIDLVFGLPLTSEGFHGCFIITEYLTKYVWAFPIKSKEAIPIAKHLFHFISEYGPPKEILSDQGTEFCNNIIDTMIGLFGINHIITSPYHPNTNGLTERYNQQFIHDLRIHSENNTLDW